MPLNPRHLSTRIIISASWIWRKPGDLLESGVQYKNNQIPQLITMKTILATFALAGITLSGYCVTGVIYFDGTSNNNPSPFATSGGLVFLDGVHPDTTQDINAALLMYNGTSYVPVVTLLLSLGTTTTETPNFGGDEGAVGDITFFANGTLLDVSGNGYEENFAGYPSGSTGSFIVQGWLGNYSSYAAAVGHAPVAETDPFTEVMTSPTGIANGIGNMPALNFMPEPSMFTLASLGAAVLMLNRRKKV